MQKPVEASTLVRSAEDRFEQFVLSCILGKIEKALAGCQGARIGFFPLGSHSRWLIENLGNEIPRERLIFFDDSLVEEVEVNGCRGLPTSMVERSGIKLMFLSSDNPSDSLRARAESLFKGVLELYPKYPKSAAERNAVDTLPWVLGPEQVPADAPVYIYGAGSCGQHWLAKLKALGAHRVAGVADSLAKGRINGFGILDPDALAERVLGDGGSVILASSAWRDIAGSLLSHGVSRLYIGSPLVARASARPSWRRPVPAEVGASSRKTPMEASPVASDANASPPSVLMPEDDLRLTNPRLVQRFIMELTDFCTFRCLYCHQNIPGFTPQHTMSDELVDYLLGYLRTHKLNVTVDLTGAGDLTMAPRWRERCDAILGSGVRLFATVNLARRLTMDELSTFSRFSSLAVSCDTIIPEVFRSIRRSMDIRTIVYNIMAIRSIGIRRGVDEPAIMITATYAAEMVDSLDLLASFAVAIGARSFGIQDLVEHTATEHNVHSVWTVTGEAALNAVAKTRLALDIVTRKGLALSLQPEFLARLDSLERSAKEGAAGPAKADCGRDVTYMEPMRPGLTRDCIDPWTFVQILGDGTVRPCCFSPTVLGRIDQTTSLEEIQNNDIAQEMRNSLLTGTLDAYCSVCNFRKQVPIQQFQARIRTLVSKATGG